MKLLNTIKICFTLLMARTFGSYQTTVWNGEYEAHRYVWRGAVWSFPAGPVERNYL